MSGCGAARGIGLLDVADCAVVEGLGAACQVEVDAGGSKADKGEARAEAGSSGFGVGRWEVRC